MHRKGRGGAHRGRAVGRAEVTQRGRWWESAERVRRGRCRGDRAVVGVEGVGQAPLPLGGVPCRPAPQALGTAAWGACMGVIEWLCTGGERLSESTMLKSMSGV